MKEKRERERQSLGGGGGRRYAFEFMSYAIGFEFLAIVIKNTLCLLVSEVAAAAEVVVVLEVVAVPDIKSTQSCHPHSTNCRRAGDFNRA